MKKEESSMLHVQLIGIWITLQSFKAGWENNVDVAEEVRNGLTLNGLK